MLTEKFANYLFSVEGKYSSNSDDTASKCHEGVHTTYGITFCNWVNVRDRIKKDSSYECFLAMSVADWMDVMDVLYFENKQFKNWDKLFAEYPILAQFLIDWAFNRGSQGMEADLANYQRKHMGIVDSNITKPEIFMNFLLSNRSETSILRDLYFERFMMYKTLGKYPKFGAGWENRVRKYYRLFAPSSVLQSLAKYDDKLMTYKL